MGFEGDEQSVPMESNPAYGQHNLANQKTDSAHSYECVRDLLEHPYEVVP